MPFVIGTKVVRIKNYKARTHRNPFYNVPASVSREFGEVVEVHANGRVRVKWNSRQFSVVGREAGEIKPIGRNLRTWNNPSTLQVI